VVPLIPLVVSLVVLGFASPAAAQLYTWTDDNGTTYYTADPWAVPPQYRPDDIPLLPPEPPILQAEIPSVPAPIPAPTPATTGGRSSANAGGSGTVVEFTPGDPIIVTARLNGVPVSLLLDTGADRTLLSPAAVARAGYSRMVVQGPSAVRILGVTGSAFASQVTVPLLDVAGTRIGPLSLIVHDAGLGPLDGLLGRDVLDAFTVMIDSAAGRATLTPR
jgi:hypothetical protein